MYALFMQDNITQIPLPDPRNATWQRVERGKNGDGSTRYARGVVVEWEFRYPLTAAQFQALTANRPPSGNIRFVTWRKPVGAAAGAMVTVEGVMDEPSGVFMRGEFHGVSVRFTQVVEV